MNSTNAIEKALQEKVNEECRWIVDKFILDMEKLSDKYGNGSIDLSSGTFTPSKQFLIFYLYLLMTKSQILVLVCVFFSYLYENQPHDITL